MKQKRSDYSPCTMEPFTKMKISSFKLMSNFNPCFAIEMQQCMVVHIASAGSGGLRAIRSGSHDISEPEVT